jgi:hypothetical protein
VELIRFRMIGMLGTRFDCSKSYTIITVRMWLCTINNERDTVITFPYIEDYWEYVKAQGTQTARIWSNLPEDVRNQVYSISPALAVNLDAFRDGVEAQVIPPPE